MFLTFHYAISVSNWTYLPMPDMPVTEVNNCLVFFLGVSFHNVFKQTITEHWQIRWKEVLGKMNAVI